MTKDGGAEVSTSQLVYCFGLLTLASTIMTVGNKAAMLSYHFPNLLTLLQNGFTSAVMVFGIWSGADDVKPFTSAQFLVFSATAACKACSSFP